MSIWFRSDWINPVRYENYNWIDFSFIHVSIDFDQRFGNLEFHVALMGLHIGGSFNVGRGDVELQASLKKTIEDIEIGDARIIISLGEYNDLREKAGVSGDMDMQERDDNLLNQPNPNTGN